MKILITGANGFMGHGIIEELLKENTNELIVTDFDNYLYDNKSLTSISADIFEIKDPYSYFKEPDVLVHLAWRDGFKHNSENHITDLEKHYKFIKKMAESGVKKIVVMGSMHEVGFHEGSIDENTVCNPMSLYGIAKNTLRQLCDQIIKDNNVKFQWIRGFYIVDNSINGCSIFSKIMQAASEGKKEFPFTTGINQYDFLDYKEFCEQVAAVILNNTEFGIINVCSGKPESLANRVERFIKENNLDISLKYGAFPDRPYDSLAIWGNPNKIRIIMETNKK